MRKRRTERGRNREEGYLMHTHSTRRGGKAGYKGHTRYTPDVGEVEEEQ